jgi:hypothetical protein
MSGPDATRKTTPLRRLAQLTKAIDFGWDGI